jgi:hypothetical protein
MKTTTTKKTYMQQNKIKTIYTNYLSYTPGIQKQYKKSYSEDMKTAYF